MKVKDIAMLQWTKAREKSRAEMRAKWKGQGSTPQQINSAMKLIDAEWEKIRPDTNPKAFEKLLRGNHGS